MSAILTLKGLGPSKNWVDDFVFFRFPSPDSSDPPSFSYSLSDIYDIVTHLGWPWKESKTRPFSSKFKYLRFYLESFLQNGPNPGSQENPLLVQVGAMGLRKKVFQKKHRVNLRYPCPLFASNPRRLFTTTLNFQFYSFI